MSVNEKMTAIADAIRAKTKETYDLNLDDMADGVQVVYNIGEADGYQANYNRFWDALQQNGNRRNYWGAFCGWSDEIFKPKYPIIAKENQSMFYMSTITSVPTIDLRDTTGLGSTFGYAQSLVEIEKIILKDDGSQTYNATFNGCKALREVRFEGVIGNDISFQACIALSKDSIVNIFAALSESATGKTLTLAKAALLAEFGSSSNEEWQALINTRKNWTISIL